MADALGTPGGVVDSKDHRLALASMVAPLSSTGPFVTRLGVMSAPGSTTLLTGTSATGTMTVNVAAHHWVTTRSPGDGVYIGTKEATGTVNIAAAPGANSRIDVVYSKQNDSASSLSPDGSTGESYAVVTGTAAASPVKPSLPVGATEIGTVTVAAGATSTNGAGVTITNTARQVVARGGIIPVRNQAERDEITAYPAVVYRLDTDTLEKHALTGSWASIALTSVADVPWVYPIRNAAYSYTLTGAMATITSGSFSVTVPSGRTLDVEFKAPRIVISNGDSRMQLVMGGVVQDYIQYSTGASLYAPARLTGSIVGTGALVTTTVQAQTILGASTVDSGPGGPVIYRYRIW